MRAYHSGLLTAPYTSFTVHNLWGTSPVATGLDIATVISSQVSCAQTRQTLKKGLQIVCSDSILICSWSTLQIQVVEVPLLAHLHIIFASFWKKWLASEHIKCDFRKIFNTTMQKLDVNSEGRDPLSPPVIPTSESETNISLHGTRFILNLRDPSLLPFIVTTTKIMRCSCVAETKQFGVQEKGLVRRVCELQYCISRRKAAILYRPAVLNF